MKRWDHVVKDHQTEDESLVGCWRLTEWRKSRKNPGTGRWEYVRLWLRHGWSNILAARIYVNDPAHLQMRYVVFDPTGHKLKSTVDRGVCERDGGSVKGAMRECDDLLFAVAAPYC
jgi:hypothetical protein